MPRTSIRALLAAPVLLGASIASATVIDTTPGLVYHLDAGVGVTSSGGFVSTWNDANGNGQSFTQATAVKQPAFISGASTGNINGLPVIRFDGDLTGNTGGVAPNADELINSTATTVQTIIVVNRTLQHRNLDGMWGLNDGDLGVRRQSATDWQHPGNSNTFSNGGSMYVNGTAGTAASLNTAGILTAVRGSSTSFSGTSIGDYFFNSSVSPRSWNGDIAEMAVFNRALTTAEQQSIESYLGSKYNITVAPEPGTLGLAAVAAAGLLIRRRRTTLR
jgi:hypothetical protein